MKHQKLRLVLMAALGVIVLLLGAYRMTLATPSENLAPEARVAAILEQGGCISCHTANPELPFYAKLPVAGDLIAKDIKEGYRAYDITPLVEALENGTMPNPVDVAKVELNLSGLGIIDFFCTQKNKRQIYIR